MTHDQFFSSATVYDIS